jgi:hypothetical protein
MGLLLTGPLPPSCQVRYRRWTGGDATPATGISSVRGQCEGNETRPVASKTEVIACVLQRFSTETEKRTQDIDYAAPR